MSGVADAPVLIVTGGSRGIGAAIAAAVMFLVSDDASYVAGANLAVAGGR